MHTSRSCGSCASLQVVWWDQGLPRRRDSGRMTDLSEVTRGEAGRREEWIVDVNRRDERPISGGMRLPPQTSRHPLSLRVASLGESSPASMAILALLAALVGGSRRSLVTSHADARFNVSLIVPPQERFLIPRVRPVAFPAACRAAHSPASVATDADAVPLAKRSHHSSRILATATHRSNTS
jgi:hypothetical protein